MNEGMISKRYAKAILEYAQDQKTESVVYDEMKKIITAFANEPKLGVVMENPILSREDKTSVINSIFDNKPSETMKRVIKLVMDNGRDRYIKMLALGYTDLYRRLMNMNTVKLITATQPEPQTVDKIKELVYQLIPSQIDFETKVEPEIEGGFILFVDTYRLDASIKSQLNRIRKKLVTENSRL